MGRYVNPGNEGFARVLRGAYVDKTGLITEFDRTLDSSESLVMVSRPRRFGKSYAAKALVAFYSHGCCSRALFEGREVSTHEGWDEHLNQYNVIRLDMTEAIQQHGVSGLVEGMSAELVDELQDLLPSPRRNEQSAIGTLTSAMLDAVAATGRKFVFIIDEWDAPYRLARDDRRAQDAYGEWLRALFKGASFTDAAIAGAYMTGILPIKKYSHQSAVSDFREYTMLGPHKYVPYTGFTVDEVAALCAEHDLDLADVRYWYDGYALRVPRTVVAPARAVDVFAPYSVMQACERGETGSYWTSTEVYESLLPYIDMDFDGLQADLLRAIGGESLRVNPDTFQNDMVSIRSRDDVLTLLIHLGYLCFDARSRTAQVPNEEIRGELRNAVEASAHKEVARVMRDSMLLLEDVLACDEEAVAAAFGRAHDAGCSPRQYNGEEALRAVVKAALIAAVDDYAVVDELPSGHGYADVAYLPKRGSSAPALLVELKWDQPVEAAIAQIRDRDYPQVLRDLGTPLLLVGVTYDTRTKRHSCRIEQTG